MIIRISENDEYIMRVRCSRVDWEKSFENVLYLEMHPNRGVIFFKYEIKILK